MAAPNALQSTVKLYQSVVEDVVLNVKEAFLDEGVDEAVLHELKIIWEGKILATKAVDSLDPNHAQKATSFTTSSMSHSTDNNNSSNSSTNNHHLNASSSHFPGMGRHFASKVKSQATSAAQNVPQVIVLNHQQHQQHPSEHSVEYSLSAGRSAVPIVHHQDSINSSFSSTGRILSSAPLGAFIRGLPQSVITTPQHVLMQVASGAHANLQNRTLNLLPPPLTSSVLVNHQQQQQHQQLINQQQRFDKLPINASSSNPNIAPGSNVIVLPPHLQQQLTQNVMQINGSNAAGSISSVDSRGGHKQKVIIQLDGPGGVSDDDDEDEFVEEDEDEEINVEDESEDQPAVHAEEGDALNSEDDEVSNENADEMFEADDVIVCQFEKVNRIRNKWKFVLKDGIINLGHKDYVFNRAVGEAEF